MVDDIFDSSRPRGRVEIRTGVGRRRRWSEEQKDRIVAESYLAGAVVSEGAARGQSPAGRHALPGEEGRMCGAAAYNSDRASCHNAGTRRETNGATIDPASRTASQLTDLADRVLPNAPARAPAPLPPRAARRSFQHPRKGPRSSATSRATGTRSTSAGPRLSLKKPTSGHVEVNPPGHRYPRHSLAVGSNDRYQNSDFDSRGRCLVLSTTHRPAAGIDFLRSVREFKGALPLLHTPLLSRAALTA